MSEPKKCRKKCKYWFDCPTDHVPDETCKGFLWEDWTDEELAKLKEHEQVRCQPNAICAVCGSGFPRSEMVTDESEGLVCKDCMANKDACPRGGHVEDYTPITLEEVKAKCEENEFVRSTNSYYASQGDPMVDLDNALNVLHCKTLAELKEAFMKWDCLRQCFVYKSLVFINSTLGGGWEAWTLKKFGDELIPFESISMQLIIKEGSHDGKTFEEYIESLLALTKEQVIHYLEYIVNDS